MSACSISAMTSPFAHARALFELQRREPAAGLHADVAAVPRDHVAGGDEHRQRRRAAGRRDHLGRARDVDFRRAPFVDVGARATDTRRRRPRRARPAGAHGSQRAARRGVAIDAQARQIAGWRVLNELSRERRREPVLNHSYRRHRSSGERRTGDEGAQPSSSNSSSSGGPSRVEGRSASR